MKGLIAVIVVVCVFDSSFCAKLPQNFPKCNRKQKDFSQCLAKAVEVSMSQLDQPIRELGLPSLNPLKVPELTIEAGTSAVGLRQKFTNIKIYGVNKLECSKMDIDFTKKTIENLCFYPEIRMDTEYDLNGKVLLLDIKGKGPGTVTLEKVNIPVNYKFEEYTKNGKKHMKITDIDLKLVPERVQFKFDNLFNGDKTLSDNVHQVVNENWKEVYGDVASSYDDAFGQITKSIFNALLNKVSENDLFGEE